LINQEEQEIVKTVDLRLDHRQPYNIIYFYSVQANLSEIPMINVNNFSHNLSV
jgi:hypothetical protein